MNDELDELFEQAEHDAAAFVEARRIMERQYGAQFAPDGVQMGAETANQHPTGCNAGEAAKWK